MFCTIVHCIRFQTIGYNFSQKSKSRNDNKHCQTSFQISLEKLKELTSFQKLVNKQFLELYGI